MAWLLGDKNNPLALTYGGTSWNNLLLLSNIDENVDYNMIYSSGHGFHMALIAFAGPGIANGLLFLLSLYLLQNPSVMQRPFLYYFIFWFNLMNLGNLYDYVPIRAFTSHADIGHINIGLNISPWWIYSIVGYLVVFLIWHFFSKTLISVYTNLKITNVLFQASLLIISTLILFGFFGGIIGQLTSSTNKPDGEIAYFLSLTSCLIIPGIIIISWPSREWVKRQLVPTNKK